jgi:hypothetical protein
VEGHSTASSLGSAQVSPGEMSPDHKGERSGTAARRRCSIVGTRRPARGGSPRLRSPSSPPSSLSSSACLDHERNAWPFSDNHHLFVQCSWRSRRRPPPTRAMVGFPQAGETRGAGAGAGRSTQCADLQVPLPCQCGERGRPPPRLRARARTSGETACGVDSRPRAQPGASFEGSRLRVSYACP